MNLYSLIQLLYFDCVYKLHSFGNQLAASLQITLHSGISSFTFAIPKDGHFHPIAETEALALSLKHVPKTSRKQLDEWAGTDGTTDGAGGGEDEHQDTKGDMFDFLKSMYAERAQGEREESESDADEQDEVLEALGGLTEQYEANASSFSGTDADLAAEVASQEYHAASEFNGMELEESWTAEQKAETLEVERARIEHGMVQSAIEKGVALQGKHFVRVAEGELADPWFIFDVRKLYSVLVRLS